MAGSGYSFVAVEVKPSSPDVSREEVEGDIRTLGKTKLTVSLGI